MFKSKKSDFVLWYEQFKKHQLHGAAVEDVIKAVDIIEQLYMTTTLVGDEVLDKIVNQDLQEDIEEWLVEEDMRSEKYGVAIAII